jgi:hypothetical protein
MGNWVRCRVYAHRKTSEPPASVKVHVGRNGMLAYSDGFAVCDARDIQAWNGRFVGEEIRFPGQKRKVCGRENLISRAEIPSVYYNDRIGIL